MFVGHYCASFVAKAVEPRIPLWVLILAAQFVDVFWVLFVLSGAEQVRIDPSLASNPLELYHMPYTHSLAGTAFWASVAGISASRIPALGGTRRAGIIVGLVVASHWFLDFLVHRPDLTLWGAPPKLGLGLWDTPLLAYGLELVLLAGSAGFYAVRCKLPSRGQRGVAGAIGVLALIQTSTAFGRVPSSVPLLVSSVLVVFIGVSYAAFRTERWAERVAD